VGKFFDGSTLQEQHVYHEPSPVPLVIDVHDAGRHHGITELIPSSMTASLPPVAHSASSPPPSPPSPPSPPAPPSPPSPPRRALPEELKRFAARHGLAPWAAAELRAVCAALPPRADPPPSPPLPPLHSLSPSLLQAPSPPPSPSSLELHSSTSFEASSWQGASSDSGSQGSTPALAPAKVPHVT
tara:strand:+ start:115 stop:669 length:555 start_codon:yes stop_codon:yes gene_type:complete